MKAIAISIVIIVALVLGCGVKIGTIEYQQHFILRDVEVQAPGVMPMLNKK
jgi:hypothetical protein